MLDYMNKMGLKSWFCVGGFLVDIFSENNIFILGRLGSWLRRLRSLMLRLLEGPGLRLLRLF